MQKIDQKLQKNVENLIEIDLYQVKKKNVKNQQNLDWKIIEKIDRNS